MLKDLLSQKKCFKLICGAGNQNLEEISRLVAVYSKAGCRFFDFAADEKVLQAAQRGLDFSVPKEEQKDYHFCISIGTKGDQHVQKARIDSQKCVMCGKCIEICPQKAVKERGKRKEELEIVARYCIGCAKCQKKCEFEAISMVRKTQSTISSLFPVPSFLSCIELHASDTDESEVDEIWHGLCENFEGMLSVCLGRQKITDEQVLSRVKRLVKLRPPFATIIQADGVPMSGSDDEIETTRAAVEMGKMIKSLNLPIFLLLSGGTNSKTAQLAKHEGVEINGVAMGSYARKSVQDFINCNDFWTNIAAQNEAVKIAKTLINSH